MGNKLTCCLMLTARRKPGRRHCGWVGSDDGSGVYQGDSRNSAAAPPVPTALEPTELNLHACEDHHVLHISELEMSEGKEAAGILCSQVHLQSLLPPRVPWKGATTSGSFVPLASWLWLASSPLIHFPSCLPTFFPSYLPKCPIFLLFPFSILA